MKTLTFTLILLALLAALAVAAKLPAMQPQHSQDTDSEPVCPGIFLDHFCSTNKDIFRKMKMYRSK